MGVSKNEKTLSQAARPRCIIGIIEVSCLIGPINSSMAVMNAANPPAVALA